MLPVNGMNVDKKQRLCRCHSFKKHAAIRQELPLCGHHVDFEADGKQTPEPSLSRFLPFQMGIQLPGPSGFGHRSQPPFPARPTPAEFPSRLDWLCDRQRPTDWIEPFLRRAQTGKPSADGRRECTDH